MAIKSRLEKIDVLQENQIAKIKKLQDLSLTNEEIAKLLEVSLESTTGTNLEESG